MKSSKFKNFLLLILMFLLSCKSKGSYDNYNLIVSWKENKYHYILKSNKQPYIGYDFDKLREKLRGLLQLTQDCIVDGGTNEQCYSLIPDKILFKYSENCTFKDLIGLKPIFDNFDGNPGFDLEINNKILHIFAITHFRGDQIFWEGRKNTNGSAEYINEKITINSDTNNVNFIYRNDTIFKGTYDEMLNKFSNEQMNIIKVGYRNWRLPDILLNTRCTLPLKRLYEISNCFPDYTYLLIKIGKHFDCSDTTFVF